MKMAIIKNLARLEAAAIETGLTERDFCIRAGIAHATWKRMLGGENVQ